VDNALLSAIVSTQALISSASAADRFRLLSAGFYWVDGEDLQEF
jgi:hypothetical protein